MSRFFGKYPGEVFDNRDPDQLGRIKAIIPDVGFIDAPTDWAYPCVAPYGGKGDAGELIVPDIGMNVWMEFEAGNPNRPIWTGIYYSRPKGRQETPSEGRGAGGASTQSPKGTDTTIGVNGVVLREPASPARPVYPQNKVFKTRNGIVIEYDDTTGNERIHFFHPSGAYKETHPDGKTAERVQGERFLVVELGEQIHIKGNRDVVVDGNLHFRASGNIILETLCGDIEFRANNLTSSIVNLITEISGAGIFNVSGNNQHL